MAVRQAKTGPARPNSAAPDDVGDSKVDKGFEETVFFIMKKIS